MGSSQTILTIIIKYVLPRERKFERFLSCIHIKPSATQRKISSAASNMKRNLFQPVPESGLKS